MFIVMRKKTKNFEQFPKNHGRLEGLGAGAVAALGRRSYAAQQEQRWSRQRQAHALCVRYGKDLLRRGQFYMR